MSIFSQKTESTQQSNPYGKAQPGLDYSLHNQEQLARRGAYGGEMIAGPNGMQQQSAMDYYNAGQGYGQLADTQKQIGGQMLPGIGQAQGYYQDRMANGGAMTQNTGQYIDMAGQMANNPYTQGIMDDAGRRATESWNQNVMGPMGGGFAGAGAADSSKYAQNYAQQGRNLAQDIQGNNLGFQGDQWNRGMGFANQAAARDDSGAMQSANMLNNQGVWGMNTLNQGYQNALMPGQIGMEVGNQQQQWDQQMIDNERMKWAEPMNFQQNYMNGIMAPAQAFGTQTSTTTQSKNPIGAAAGIAAQLGAAYMTGGASLFAGAASQAGKDDREPGIGMDAMSMFGGR